QNHAPHRLTAVRVLERGKGDANCDQLFWAGNVGFESHDWGQNRKSSKSANVFRFAPESGHARAQRAIAQLCLPQPYHCADRRTLGTEASHASMSRPRFSSSSAKRSAIPAFLRGAVLLRNYPKVARP